MRVCVSVWFYGHIRQIDRLAAEISVRNKTQFFFLVCIFIKLYD